MSNAPDVSQPDLQARQASALGRALALAYGAVTYTLFLAIFLYLIGFIGGFLVSKTLDSGAVGGLWSSAAVNVGLLALFGVSHTVMARPAFKRWWTRFVPEPIERSTYVLTTVGILGLLVWDWRPMPDVVWQIEGGLAIALWVLFAVGWGIVLLSTFLIDHFDLFGLRQTISFALGQPYAGPQFREILLYRLCRHPLMLGFMIAFWATPTMTVGHLLFAGVATAYILVAIRIEEATLLELHPVEYADYMRRVRGLIPIPRG